MTTARRQAKDVTRDYHLELDPAPGPKLLSVFGGKITTARALAIQALDRLGIAGFKFTATSPLPGGQVTPRLQRLAGRAGRLRALCLVLERLSRAYGTRLDRIFDGVERLDQLGRHFGAGLYEREVRYLLDTEFACTAEDILWRRTKLGLQMKAAEQAALTRYVGA